MLIEKREKKDGAKWEEIELKKMVDEIVSVENPLAGFLGPDPRQDILISLKIALYKKYETSQAEYRII